MKKTTKQRIRESLAYWQGRLDQLNESGSGKDAVEELLKMAKQIVPDQADLAQKALSQVNEGTGSGILAGLVGAMLAVGMMGRIQSGLSRALGSVQAGKAEARVEQCDKTVQEIHDSLTQIEKNLEQIAKDTGTDDETLQKLGDEARKWLSRRAAEKQAKFKKIMAEP